MLAEESFFGKCVRVESVAKENLLDLKRLNNVIFPFVYRDNFYAEILKEDSYSYLST